MLDLVRYERFHPAALWAREYGSASNPRGARLAARAVAVPPRVAGYRLPGHAVHGVRGRRAGNPLHARKLAAALQNTTAAPPDDRPVLLRREHEVGHVARAVSRSIPLWLDQLCFFARQLGLRTGQAVSVSRP